MYHDFPPEPVLSSDGAGSSQQILKEKDTKLNMGSVTNKIILTSEIIMERKDHDDIVKFSVKQCEMCKKVDSILLIQKEQRDFCLNRTINISEDIGNKPSWVWLLTICGGMFSATLILFSLLFVNQTTDINAMRTELRKTKFVQSTTIKYPQPDLPTVTTEDHNNLLNKP